MFGIPVFLKDSVFHCFLMCFRSLQSSSSFYNDLDPTFAVAICSIHEQFTHRSSIVITSVLKIFLLP